MMPFIYYLIKVVICSTLLYGYYYVGLRNRVFHSWNRFYLLSAVFLSLFLPFLKLTLPVETSNINATEALRMFTDNEAYVIYVNKHLPNIFTWEKSATLCYIAISTFILLTLLKGYYKIARLIRSHSFHKYHGAKITFSNAEGTPFSFFNYLFWNSQIDINTITGQQILSHELVHSKQKHSLDNLVMNLLLVLFWLNPIFWLIRNELRMIHEFIADKKAIANADTTAFSHMILQATYPHSYQQLVSSFYQSSIKRRLMMFTKAQNQRISYISRIIVIPLLLFVSLAFAVKTTTDSGPDYQLPKTMATIKGTNLSNNNEITAYRSPELEPQFPGGTEAWRQFLQNHLNMDAPLAKGVPAGVFVTETQFLVDKEGRLSDFKPLSKHGYGLEEEAIRIFKLSPHWIPAKQKGRAVNAYKNQKITFVIAESN